MAGTRQRHPLPSAMPRHSAKFFCFFCFWPPIFLCSLFKAPGTPSYNLGIFCGFLIYLVTLFRLLDFFEKYKFELHVIRIMEFNDSKNDSHVTECSVRLYPGTDPKFRTSWSRNMTANLRAKCF